MKYLSMSITDLKFRLQIRRAIHRLQDALALVEKNQVSLQTNCSSVTEEVDEIYRRLLKGLKDRTESLRGEIDRYLTTEQRNLRTLKENLEQEISNIQSNCELADKHITENVEWDDCELMDAKEIFLKTVEFIRNFEYENADYARRVRFSMATDPNQLVLHVANYGELSIAMPFPSGGGPPVTVGGGGGLLQPPGSAGPGLMRSKSDHRLASQFRQQEERGGGYHDGEGEGRASPLGGRKFGERYAGRSYGESQGRYGRGGGGGGGDDYDYEEGGSRSRRYRASRLTSRHLGGGADNADSDTDGGHGGRSVRFAGDCTPHAKERERVLDTEDASRGPLSGISRLYDSPRVMKRLQESELRTKKREKEPPPQPPAPTPKSTPAAPKKAASRQVSEEDEISKIKKQNKASGSGVEAEQTRPQAERVAALKQQRSGNVVASEESTPAAERRTPPSSPQQTTPPTQEVSAPPGDDSATEWWL